MKLPRLQFVCVIVSVFGIAFVHQGFSQQALKGRPHPAKVSAEAKPKPHRLCGTPEASGPEAIRRAVENTRLLHPDVYAEMVKVRLEKTGAYETTYGIGDKRKFFCKNRLTDSYYLLTAELRASGALSEIWVDSIELANGNVANSDVQALLNGLEASTPRLSRDSTKGIIKLDNQFFGNPPNINVNGTKGAGSGKVTFLVTDIKDSFSPPSNYNYVAGYFDPNDQQVSNNGSNKMDMLYIDSYPGIYYNEVSDVAGALLTMAHEYQHLIHYNYDATEQIFVNEGFSMYAEIICGYGMIDLSDYLQNTNVSLFTWSSQMADYERAEIWTLYLCEQGGDSVSRKIVQNVAHGISGIDQGLMAAGSSLRFDNLFRNWGVANYMNDKNVDVVYGYNYGFDSRASASHTYSSDPNQSVTNESIQNLAEKYVLFSSADSLRITFSGSSGIIVKAVLVGGPGGKSVLNVPLGTQFAVSGYYPVEMFVVTNPNQADGGAGSYSFTSSGKQRETFSEIAYDDGSPKPFQGNADFLAGGTGVMWAVGFRPAQTQNRLAAAKLMVAFDQEFYGSTTPVDAPKRFLLHVWDSQNGTTPGADIISPVLVTSYRSDFTGEFLEVDLTAYSQQLMNLPTQIFIGLSEDDQYVTSIALNNATSQNYTYVYGVGGGSSWVAMSNLRVGTVSLAGWNAMFRAVFAYRTVTGVETLEDLAPDRFELSQNYPNPFNPLTVVGYKLQVPSDVSLSVYDMLGREVKSLVSGRQSTGSYQVVWDGTDREGVKVATGVYLYQIVATPVGGQGKSYVETKKLMLLR